MIQTLKKIASQFGFDKAILFTSSANIMGALGSLVSLILVVKYLTNVEQGFYYTFGSIVAIQIFFELGLNGIITQYVAHEASNLKWKGDYILYGDSKYVSRLSSLLHFSIKWYLSFAIILLLTLVTVGLFFFNSYSANNTVSWITPWILLTFGTSINLILSPIVAFIQGLGKVKEIAKIQFLQQIFRFLAIWIGLILGARLYVLGIGSIIGIFILLLKILSKYRKLLINIWETVIIEKVHYRKEIFPYQWKIAISWISGYFIFQLFNPVLFATEGPIVAGQMGITLTALNGILSLSLAWITTKVPLFSGLIAQKEYKQLDIIFNRTLKQSALINFTALTIIGFAISIIRFFNIEADGRPIGDRFLNFIPMLLMMIPVFLNQFVAAWATYLRCHKREPYLANSLVSAILCSISTVLLGKYFGVIGVTTGYLVIGILLFPWSYYIFKAKKLEWHSLSYNEK